MIWKYFNPSDGYEMYEIHDDGRGGWYISQALLLLQLFTAPLESRGRFSIHHLLLWRAAPWRSHLLLFELSFAPSSFIWVFSGNIPEKGQGTRPESQVLQRDTSKLPLEEELGAQVCYHKDGSSWAASSHHTRKEAALSQENWVPGACVPNFSDLAAEENLCGVLLTYPT